MLRSALVIALTSCGSGSRPAPSVMPEPSVAPTPTSSDVEVVGGHTVTVLARGAEPRRALRYAFTQDQARRYITHATAVTSSQVSLSLPTVVIADAAESGGDRQACGGRNRSTSRGYPQNV